MVRQLFNEIIKQNVFTPEAWKKVKIKVIQKKKGDVENVRNFRPICSLPALYKLCTTILYSRLYPRPDQIQAEDQAGFRSSFQTTDHLATYRMIDQKCHEWKIKMWAATIDFTKAFDSITHQSIWNALKSCSIEHDYISLLKKLYRDHKATVLRVWVVPSRICFSEVFFPHVVFFLSIHHDVLDHQSIRMFCIISFLEHLLVPATLRHTGCRVQSCCCFPNCFIFDF